MFDEHSFPFAEITNNVSSATDLDILEDFTASVQAPVGATHRPTSRVAPPAVPTVSLPMAPGLN